MPRPVGGVIHFSVNIKIILTSEKFKYINKLYGKIWLITLHHRGLITETPFLEKSAGFCVLIIPQFLLGTGAYGYMAEMLWYRRETRQ